MTEAGAALRRCVGDERAFADEFWGRRPLLHTGGGEEGFDALLDLADVDHLVTSTLLRLPGMRLVKDGKPLPSPGYTRTITVGSRKVREAIRPERVIDEFGNGATIVLQALHRQWPPVARFCRELELSLTHPVQANAYITPATSKGFAVHHDTHDVFVLQTRGRKAWRVYPPIVELAGKEQRWSKELGEPGEPLLEAELAPGDSLYIPRGFPHDAVAREEVSIHVTVGILARTWLDLWRHGVREAADHAPFREALPIGFARDAEGLAEEMRGRAEEFAVWFEKMAGPDLAESFSRSFWRHRRPILEGQLVHVAAVDDLGLETPVSRRPDGIFEVSTMDEEAVVLLGNREIRMPRFAAPTLRYIEQAHGRFDARDLPDGLDDASRLVLLRRLVREGALKIDDPVD